MIPHSKYICQKCGNQGAELRYCADSRRLLGCDDTSDNEHIHVSCLTCRYEIERTEPES